MRCLKNCEFLKFDDGQFICTYYNSFLKLQNTIDVGRSFVSPLRCSTCEKDGFVGTNTVSERAKKLKKHLSYMADSFYSHKDEFEESLTEMYRILKSMEEEGIEDEQKRLS